MKKGLVILAGALVATCLVAVFQPKAAGKLVIDPMISMPGAAFSEEGFERTGDDVRMSSDYRERLVGDRQKFVAGFRSQKSYTGGPLARHELSRVRADSFFWKLGVSSGDILTAVNERPLPSESTVADEILTNLHSPGQMTIDVERDGKLRRISISSM